jgi:hypothetical protein
MKKIAVAISALALLGACAARPEPVIGQPIPLAKPADPAPAPLDSRSLLGIEDLLAKIVPDAQFASALAASRGDQLAVACHNAVAALAQQQLAQLRALPTALPEPHLITTFQIGRDLVKLGQAGIPQPLIVGCAPLAADAKLDVLGLLNKMLGAAAAALFGG